MNGRIDGPLLGRFLSPDPHIQDEGLLQNYNRYSYVLNNPLRYTDPSGELWFEIAAFIVGAALASSNNRDLKIVGTFLMMWALGPGVGTEAGLLMQAGASKGLAYSRAAGISNTTAYGPEAGLKAGAFAAAFAYVGANIPGAMSPERIIAHAVLGCVQQASSSGQCGPGAAAAAFGKIATGLTQVLGEAAQFAVTTVVGGTVSVIGGGKFANCAAQAGFGYLFNELGTLYQRGYPHGSGMGRGTHWYDIENPVCASSASGTVDSVNEQIRRYPAPSMCSVTPGCDAQPVRSGDRSFAIPVGFVEHQVSNTLVINQTIAGRHALHDGTVLRFAIERDGQIFVRSLGFGTGRLPGPNFSQAQRLWGAVDSQIRKHLQGN